MLWLLKGYVHVLYIMIQKVTVTPTKPDDIILLSSGSEYGTPQKPDVKKTRLSFGRYIPHTCNGGINICLVGTVGRFLITSINCKLRIFSYFTINRLASINVHIYYNTTLGQHLQLLDL